MILTATSILTLTATSSSIKKKKEVCYGFSYKDLAAASSRPVSVETSVNNTTRAEYKVSAAGVYALYDARSKTAVTFEVKIGSR